MRISSVSPGAAAFDEDGAAHRVGARAALGHALLDRLQRLAECPSR